MSNESYPEPTIESVLENIQRIENEVEQLKQQLRKSNILNASIAMTPLHCVDESGWDSVYDPIDSVQLERLYGDEALEYAISQLGFMERQPHNTVTQNGRISQVAARRSIGLIHIVPLNEHSESDIRNMVSEINQTKLNVKKDLRFLFPKTMERNRKFYSKYYPKYLPKSITRLIQIAPKETTRVTFSWLNKGYSMEKMDRKQTLDFIDRINREKLASNPDINLTLDEMNENDEIRLSNYKTFYRILPAKLNPRQQTTIRADDGKPKQLPPQRAVIPLLVVQPKPLDSYHELADLSSLSSLRLCKNKKLVEHIPAIEEYGLFVWDEKRRADKAR